VAVLSFASGRVALILHGHSNLRVTLKIVKGALERHGRVEGYFIQAVHMRVASRESNRRAKAKMELIRLVFKYLYRGLPK